MRERVISGAAVGIITILLIVLGGNVLAAALLIVSCIAYRELLGATKVMAGKAVGPLGLVGFAGIFLYYFALALYDGQIFGSFYRGLPLLFLIFFFMVGILMLMLAVYVFKFPVYDSNQVMAGYFSFIYGPCMLSFVYLTERLPVGRIAVWMIFISSWVCDTCAYFVGKALGKHKMAPVLSPKKTIEGAMGGVAGSAVLGAVYGRFAAPLILSGSGSLKYAAIFAVICSAGALISMVGDLAASAIKRNHDIKDYGKLIPGHGGIMDRFDSVIFTAPIVFFLSVLLL